MNSFFSGTVKKNKEKSNESEMMRRRQKQKEMQKKFPHDFANKHEDQ